MRNLDWWLKRLWLVIGAVMLALLVVAVGAILYSFFSESGRGRGAVTVQAGKAPEERPVVVRYTLPAKLRGTDTRLVMVTHGEEGARARRGAYDSYSSYDGTSGGPLVNVLFLDAQGSGRLLLDRPGYIERVDFPAALPARPGEEARDSLQTWISYVMALDDGNGDGRLDGRDDTSLYVSALDGTGLRRVLPAGLRLQSYQPLEGGRVLVLALDARGAAPRAENAGLMQRAFVYDVAAGRLAPHAGLDSLSAAAAHILRR